MLHTPVGKRLKSPSTTAPTAPLMAALISPSKGTARGITKDTAKDSNMRAGDDVLDERGFLQSLVHPTERVSALN